MAENTAGPGDLWDGEGIGRKVDVCGPQDISEAPVAHDLRAAAVESGGTGLEPTAAGNDGEICGLSGKDEGPSAQEEPAGHGFYKSQEEVDRAFGRRLAAERRRWEREHQEELQQAQLGQEVHNLAEADTWLPQQQMYAREYAYYADLVTQANTLAKNRSEFDLMEELKNNTAFERMVSDGVPVNEAYKMVGQAPQLEKEQCIRQDERCQIMKEIESRTQSMPPVDHNPGLSGPALDVTRMSEEELTRLADRVRKGERVVI